MTFSKLSSEQAKVAINASQLFETLDNHREDSQSVAGSMHWKRINGKEYLYRAYSHGKNTSLGPRCAEAEDVKAQFSRRKRAYTEREKSLEATLAIHAAYVRVNHLNRFPQLGAQIIRALQRDGVRFQIVGTAALFAYEMRAGALIELASAALSGSLDVVVEGGQHLDAAYLLDSCDTSFVRKTFTPNETWTNSQGYRVELMSQAEDGPRVPSDLLTMVFDQRGMPLRLSTPDPRAWINAQPDAESDLASLVAALLETPASSYDEFDI